MSRLVDVISITGYISGMMWEDKPHSRLIITPLPPYQLLFIEGGALDLRHRDMMTIAG